MGSVHARGDTFLTFVLKALTETNTSRLATGPETVRKREGYHQVLKHKRETITFLKESNVRIKKKSLFY
jgi:hypothetical protein